MTKVFISHKKEDSETALEVSSILEGNRIDYYLDVLDPQLEGNGDKLTRHLQEKLRECTHLLAVLSYNTQLSWWVPFEIGIATEKEFPISTYLTTINESLIPDYLWTWPILRKTSDLKIYTELIGKEKNVILSEEIKKSYGAVNVPKNYAEAFHKRMKMQLNQRP